ncbi:hypothetical protein AUEXF2481DRAFT_36493 [Aureobasidium subglaciale EXF-2481]|uniref:Uncharacterized protein n=1 Tax=Aureobasidium subglaciale (strain EXF-2481) TaxID=1043005 RepID=A0A074ZLB0_AURSE|nr:uncharacterized protein AUEXF2481DRAFT_36493 [Aureobasidium subglaciale EXF-2481]KEQ99186.1 hypothetical protein AUEXF2481DRAFT_36493 [Aureobasidium subglaciale EXF-2481]
MLEALLKERPYLEICDYCQKCISSGAVQIGLATFLLLGFLRKREVLLSSFQVLGSTAGIGIYSLVHTYNFRAFSTSHVSSPIWWRVRRGFKDRLSRQGLKIR